jgi:putative ATP-binding cassette transporter
MKALSICVGVVAIVALLVGIKGGGGDLFDLAADPALLSIAVVGLGLAVTTFRLPLISPFLRVFSAIFAVEYILTTLAYIAAHEGWWPPSLSEVAPPASLPSTVAIFGLVVHLISFIPVIGQITRLADPYFVTSDREAVQVAGFGTRQVTERRLGSLLVVALVVITQFQGRNQHSPKLLQSRLVQLDSK